MEETSKMETTKMDINNAFLSILDNKWDHAYLCEKLKYCNAEMPRSFAKGFISYPKYSMNNKQKAVGLQKLSNAFEVIKPDDKQGMRIQKLTGVSDDDYQQQILAVKCLTDFWKDHKVHEQSLAAIREKEDVSETVESSVLAAHIFSKLVVGGLDSVIVDKNKKGQLEKCPCGCGTNFVTGDTGIGSPRVWHGSSDMLVKQTAISVAPLTVVVNDSEDSNEFSQGNGDQNVGPSTSKQQKLLEEQNIHQTAEVKKKGFDIYDFDFTTRVVCQCLTNGFAQKSSLNFSNSLVPSIGCNVDHMLIYLYDPDQDILLRRQHYIDLVDDRGSLLLPSIIELWIVLNLNIFGPTMPEQVTYKLHKCGFKQFLQTEGVLEEYGRLQVAVGGSKLTGKSMSRNPSIAKSGGAVEYILE